MLVGVDVQTIEEIEWSLEHFGDRYARRVFSVDELTECTGHLANDARTLARKFAVKEAVMKLLGLEDAAPAWTTIEYRCRAGGDTVELSGTARQLARRQGIEVIFASVSDAAGMVTAAVMADENGHWDQEE
jgi:holo-[acyl-carrier protein] synthase